MSLQIDSSPRLGTDQLDPVRSFLNSPEGVHADPWILGSVWESCIEVQDESLSTDSLRLAISFIRHSIENSSNLINPQEAVANKTLLDILEGDIPTSITEFKSTPGAHIKRVGACYEAEPNFQKVLEKIAPIYRGGFVVVVDAAGTPILLEKIDQTFTGQDLGSTYSSLSLTPLQVDEVLLPAGQIFGVTHKEEFEARQPTTVGQRLATVVGLQSIDMLTPRRTSTFAIDKHRRYGHSVGRFSSRKLTDLESIRLAADEIVAAAADDATPVMGHRGLTELVSSKAD